MLGVRGRLPAAHPPQPVLHHRLGGELRAHLRPAPRHPGPGVALRLHAERHRPARRAAGHENLFVLIPVPADVSIGSGGVDGGGRPPRSSATADAAIAQIAAWAGIPDLADRIVVRRTVGPKDFADRPERVAGRRAGARAHPPAERVLPPEGTHPSGSTGLLYAGVDHHPGHRAAHVPDQCRARREAPARRDRQRVRWRSPSAPAAPPAERPFSAGAGAVSVVYLTCLLVALGAMVLLDRRFRLFFWRDARRAVIVLIVGVAVLPGVGSRRHRARRVRPRAVADS